MKRNLLSVLVGLVILTLMACGSGGGGGGGGSDTNNSGNNSTEIGYIVNSGSNNITVGNLKDESWVATINVDNIYAGRALDFNPSCTRAYVSDWTDKIYVIDSTNHSLITSISAGGYGVHYEIAVNPSDTRLYVATTEGLVIFDTSTNSFVAQSNVCTSCKGLAFHPSGSMIYATEYVSSGNASVKVIDASNTQLIDSIPLSDHPRQIVINSTGTRAYITHTGGAIQYDSVSVIDLTNNSVVTSIPLPDVVDNLAINSSGSRVYVSDHGNVYAIDTSTNTIVDTINLVGNYVNDIAINDSGSKVYVTLYNDNTVSVIDTASNSVTNTYPVGLHPEGIDVCKQ